jgi:hypothetical protein
MAFFASHWTMSVRPLANSNRCRAPDECTIVTMASPPALYLVVTVTLGGGGFGASGTGFAAAGGFGLGCGLGFGFVWAKAGTAHAKRNDRTTVRTGRDCFMVVGCRCAPPAGAFGTGWGRGATITLDGRYPNG